MPPRKLSAGNPAPVRPARPGPVAVPKTAKLGPVTAVQAATLGSVVDPAKVLRAVVPHLAVGPLVTRATEFFTPSPTQSQSAKADALNDSIPDRLDELAAFLHRNAMRPLVEGETPPEPSDYPLASPSRIITSPSSPPARASLGILRLLSQMAVSSQRRHLTALTATLKPEQRTAVEAVLTDYAVNNAALMMESMGMLPGASQKAVDALRTVLSAGPEGLTDKALDAAVAKLQAPVSRVNGEALKRALLASDEQLQPFGALLQQLEKDLAPLVQSTPEAKAAYEEMRKDVVVMGKVFHPLAVTMTALGSRTEANTEAMVARAKGALLHSNMAVLKILQTVLQAKVDQTSPRALKELKDFVQNGLVAEGSPIPMIRSVVESDPKFAGQKLEDLFTITDEGIKYQAGASTAIGVPARSVVPAGDGLPERVVNGWLKVIKPGVDEDIVDARRVVRILGDMLSFDAGGAAQSDELAILNVVDSIARAGLDELDRELDQPNERDNMTAVRGNLQDVEMFVPRSFEARSGLRFTFMEQVHGWHLSQVVTHYMASRRAHRQGDYRGTRGLEHNVDRRVKQWALRTYGMEPARLEKTRFEGGIEVKLAFNDRVYPEATVRMMENGDIASESRRPDLSREAFARLRTRVMQGQSVSTLRGRGHADMTDRNFMVFPDQMVPALIDLGSVLKPKLRQFLAPARFAVGSFLGRTRMMARAYVDMTHDSFRLAPEERTRLITALAEDMDAHRKAHPPKGNPIQNLPVVWSRMDALGKDRGLRFANEYLQMARLFTATQGNLKQFKLGMEESSLNVRQIAGDLLAAYRRSRMNIENGQALDDAKDLRVLEMGGVTEWLPMSAAALVEHDTAA